MEPSLTYSQVKSLAPCHDDFARVIEIVGGQRRWEETPVTARMARDAGVTLDDVLWVAEARVTFGHDEDVERRLSLWKADLSARVLHFFERSRPTDLRPRTATIARRLRARGEIDYADWNAASEAAHHVVDEIIEEVYEKNVWGSVEYHAWTASQASAWSAAQASARKSAPDVARSSTRAFAWDAVRKNARFDPTLIARSDVSWASVRRVESVWQFDRLIARLSDPEPEDWPLPPLSHDRESCSLDETM